MLKLTCAHCKEEVEPEDEWIIGEICFHRREECYGEFLEELNAALNKVDSAFKLD